MFKELIPVGTILFVHGCKNLTLTNLILNSRFMHWWLNIVSQSLFALYRNATIYASFCKKFYSRNRIPFADCVLLMWICSWHGSDGSPQVEQASECVTHHRLSSVPPSWLVWRSERSSTSFRSCRSREEASGLFFFFVALLPFLKSAEVSRNSTKDKKLDSNQWSRKIKEVGVHRAVLKK